MRTLGAARTALADAVTAAGVKCAPYAPDSLMAPAAYVDTFTADWQSGASMLTVDVTATIVAVVQRNDGPGGMQQLEDAIGDVTAALEKLPGTQVLAVATGSVTVGDKRLPGAVYTVRGQLERG